METRKRVRVHVGPHTLERLMERLGCDKTYPELKDILSKECTEALLYTDGVREKKIYIPNLCGSMHVVPDQKCGGGYFSKSFYRTLPPKGRIKGKSPAEEIDIEWHLWFEDLRKKP